MRAHLQNLSYILRHKVYVLLAGLGIGGIPLWRLLIHDWSKFLPIEWFGYTNYFYKNGGRARHAASGGMHVPSPESLAFDEAWGHHISKNPHHWQYWIMNDGVIFPMPDHFLREMVADWIGAGRAQGHKEDISDWYERNKRIIVLHPETRAKVERLIYWSN